MSADSLAVALMALDDPDVRERVRNGDLTAFHPDVSLASNEEELVKAAAAEEIDPEVAGFDASSSAFFRAASLVPGNVLSGPVSNNFKIFMQEKFGGIGGSMAGNCACPPMNFQAFGGFAE
jgi:hypothetical protein